MTDDWRPSLEDPSAPEKENNGSVLDGNNWSRMLLPPMGLV